MKKVLYITPHLSTGGLPQYLLKKIETFKNNYEIFVLEWEDITGGELVVQRKKIQSLLGDNFFSLESNKERVFDIINKVRPDIIHFEEIADTFIPTSILQKIYTDKREYYIVSTTHSSSTNPKQIRFGSDKYVLVSNWSKKIFDEHYKGSVVCDVWEYPIEDKSNYDKDYYKNILSFDPNYKHVLHVGLFTHGKNQKFIIDVAKKCLDHKILFHFVGNMAGNFKDYWSPLMEDLPANCICHYEREDVESFYKASDLFFFPSLWELCPLSIKEAISYNIPMFLTKLETYEDYFDKYATYITLDADVTAKKLIDFFNLNDKEKIEHTPPVFHILTDIDTDREIKSMQSLTKMEDYGFEYIPIISKRYIDLPPKETCQYPDKISVTPGNSLTPSHYGCYLGHKKAFYEGLKIDADYMLIFECDAIIDVPHSEFQKKINLALEKIESDDLLMFSFGFHNNTNIVEKKDDYWVVNKFYGAHAYLIPKKSYHIIDNLYKNCKWNVTDLFFADNLSDYKIGIFPTPITKQSEGYSILDKVFNHERY